MPSLQHLHPEYCHRSRNGLYTFPSSFHGRHIHQVLVNGRNGSIHTVPSHHVKCSSPTTPPAERRAYAAREQERKAKRHSTSSEDSDSSKSTPSSIRHAHGRRGHGRYDPTLKAKRPTSANKIPPKHSQKAHKSAEISDRQDSDTDSSYSTTAHVPRPRRHPYISHHHQSHQHHHRHRHYEAPPEHYVVKVPFPTHCSDCCQTVVPPTPDALPATKIRTQPSVETSRENLKKAKHCSSNCAHGCANPPSSSMAQRKDIRRERQPVATKAVVIVDRPASRNKAHTPVDVNMEGIENTVTMIRGCLPIQLLLSAMSQVPRVAWRLV
ncbi:hypothetical protein POX_a01287 [Penicillium oxalicum]|uniref:hypothetical protein n=1 Tax=Penicillium oxalicum TaxID=69781 RepID=UPI0020B7BE3B|nr:hypothetical protein POX_a01287 [Penicillium oxalicum]KAI2794686.1 hypothetical protein POX_a01287 [Penicillium oxalicum]